MSFQTLQTLGALLGIVAFFWRVCDVFRSYLTIALTVERDDFGQFSAKVTVENRGVKAKGVDNALLLICPENINPIAAYNAVLNESGSNDQIRSLRGVAVNIVSAPIYATTGTAIIPLPFFYLEQCTVRDESRTFRVSIDTEPLIKGIRYSVYFLLWGTGHTHRMSQDSFIVPNDSNQPLKT